MNREDKIKFVLEKGWSCLLDTGQVFNKKGNKIGSIDKKGYIILSYRFNGKFFKLKAHQLIYYVAYGKIVDNIDHKNRNRADNRISNLRETTHEQNMKNTKICKGYYKSGNKYVASVGRKYIGVFTTADEAHQAYMYAKKNNPFYNEL